MEFQKAGITACEIRSGDCWGCNGLGFAHSLKRRNILTEAHREEVILACNACHDQIEILREEDMGNFIRRTIAARRVPVKSIFDKIEERG